MKTELQIQKWLQRVIASDTLHEHIQGRDQIQARLSELHSSEYWPSFPIDYLTRLRLLESSEYILKELHSLELVSSSNRNISRKKSEALFADLLYCNSEKSHFVAIELKRDKATTRQAITELLAYEHEIQNHIPFASNLDILFVIVSRDFPTLLDHAVTGLVTWGRRNILCLQFDDKGRKPMLSVHIPSAWSALGQNVLPEQGLQIAHLCLYPNKELSPEELRGVCQTAVAIMARESERVGGSGFALVADNIFYPRLSECPYTIIVGALNPYCFLSEAERTGFAASTDSVVSQFLLDEDRKEELTLAWDWFGAGGDAALKYLKQYGRPHLEGFSCWSHFRDSRRWSSESVTSDRFLVPLEAEFWGVMGDFAREVVINQKRLENFLPGFSKPGLDWRCPWLAIVVLDEIAVRPVVESGEWTFGAFWGLGIRLGRLAAFGAHYSKSEEAERRKVLPGLFWAEIDVIRVIEEVRLRYIAASSLKNPPPVIPIGGRSDLHKLPKQISAFANWILDEFIQPEYELLRHAFVIGLQSYGLFDGLFSKTLSPKVRLDAIKHAKSWLILSVQAIFGDHMSPHSVTRSKAASRSLYVEKIPLNATLDDALNAIEQLSEADLLKGLFRTIPEMMSLWHPQLSHVLVPMATHSKDWDWMRGEIDDARKRGLPNPCILVTPGGHVGTGSVPDGLMHVPQLVDPDTQVLVVLFESTMSVARIVKWDDLRSGAERLTGPRIRS